MVERSIPERKIEVECYSGHKADERPVRIRFETGPAEIADVEDRWYSPGETLFRVRLLNGDRYVLRHLEAQDTWTIQAFTARAPHSP